jgi:ribonuclease J
MKKNNPTHLARLNIFPFGGLGEIGMNMLALEVAKEVMLFDCGMMFQDLSGLGLDYALPNFTKLYEFGENVKGLVLTHGHEDHIGGVGHFIKAFPKVPIYASPLTKDLLMAKAGDFPVLRSKRFRLFSEHKVFKVGGFSLTAVGVSHSIPDAHGFVIDSAAGRIIHSGDMKYEFDHLKKFEKWFKRNHYFKNYLDRPILCYFGDSTNVSRSHRMLTEETVGKNLKKLVKNQKEGLTVVTLFASNMERVAKIFEAAHAAGKKIILCGRSLNNYVGVGEKHGVIPKYPDLKIDDSEFENMPRHKVVVVCTGSQAEPRAALMRIAMGTHRTIALEEGDHVIMSSRFIPGNERNISRMINELMIQGALVTTDHENDIHVSGHAFKEESVMTLQAIRPKYFIPVHGEYHHMVKHAQLAEDLGNKGPDHVIVMRNGKSISLGEDGFSELPDFDIKRWTHDYGKLVPLISPPISQRKRLGRNGFIICSMRPKLHLFAMGLVIEDACIQACEAHRKTLVNSKSMPPSEKLKQMRSFLQRYFRKRHDRKPYVIITDQEFQPYDPPKAEKSFA